MKTITHLVAHRGQIADYPENSLESLQAAIACGAKFLEVDVQLSADLVPLLSHDATLERTGNQDIDIRSRTFSELITYQVGEAIRFGDRFKDVFIPSLQQTITLLETHPDVQIFVELKQESFDIFGVETVVDSVLSCTEKLAAQVVIISYNLDSLKYLQTKSSIRCGWIIHELDKESLTQAHALAPNFMFINHEACQNNPYIFAGDPWDWVLYESSDPAVVQALFDRGVTYVESNDISLLLQHFK